MTNPTDAEKTAAAALLAEGAATDPLAETIPADANIPTLKPMVSGNSFHGDQGSIPVANLVVHPTPPPNPPDPVPPPPGEKNLTATEVIERFSGKTVSSRQPYQLTHVDAANINAHVEEDYAEAGEIIYPLRDEQGQPYLSMIGNVRVLLGVA